MQQFMDSAIFMWGVLPALIFVARIFDVSIGTIRIIFVARSKKFLAPLLGFFEVLIWLLAMRQIMANLDNMACFVAYAAGFATGNFIGILLEERLALGTLIIRIFLAQDDAGMKNRLYEAGYGVTSIDAHGRHGNVEILYVVIRRKALKQVVEIIEEHQSNAFYSIEDAKSVKQGIFPTGPKRASTGKVKRSALKKRDRHYARPGK